MEQFRVGLAIALSFLVFLIWNQFFVDKEAPKQREVNEQAQEMQKEDVFAPAEKLTADQDTAEDIEQIRIAQVAESTDLPRLITVASPYYQVQISEKIRIPRSYQSPRGQRTQPSYDINMRAHRRAKLKPKVQYFFSQIKHST